MAGPSSTRSRPGLSLMARALQALAGREHSRQELRTKLLRWAAEEPDADARVELVLEQLAQRGHLSEARFVESRVHARAARFGNRRIEAELRRHGLAPDDATRAQLRSSEMARALEVWRKKFGVPGATAAERARQARFLTARGFSSDVVRQLVLRGADVDPA
ncbi:MAG: recombination regulator RecX [Burkholderiaceae bacterium]